MTRTPTRRDVLKTTATAGMTTTVLPTGAAAGSAIRTIEAGIRYDLEIRDDFSTLQLDSRPPFTINGDRKELWLANRVSQSRVNGIADAGVMADEQPLGVGQAKTLRENIRTTMQLPTALSGRMRPKRGVSLETEHRLPEVSIQRNGPSPKLVLPSAGTVSLEPCRDYEVELEPETVEVTTVRFTDEKVPIEGRPEHRWGNEREYDSLEVTATPVVEVVDHGDLVLRRRDLA